MIDLVKPHETQGYEILSEENQQLFTDFLKNFYRVWEHPENYVPFSVYVSSEDGKKFLKFCLHRQTDPAKRVVTCG